MGSFPIVLSRGFRISALPMPLRANCFYRPIDVFITYDGKRAADIPASRYAVRQMVAAEVSWDIALRIGHR